MQHRYTEGVRGGETVILEYGEVVPLEVIIDTLNSVNGQHINNNFIRDSVRFTIQARQVSKTAIELFGVDTELLVVIEELSELTKEITKFMRKDTTGSHENLVNEIADVEIGLIHVMNIFGVESEESEEAKWSKLNRLKDRIRKASKKSLNESLTDKE